MKSKVYSHVAEKVVLFYWCVSNVLPDTAAKCIQHDWSNEGEFYWHFCKLLGHGRAVLQHCHFSLHASLDTACHKPSLFPALTCLLVIHLSGPISPESRSKVHKVYSLIYGWKTFQTPDAERVRRENSVFHSFP